MAEYPLPLPDSEMQDNSALGINRPTTQLGGFATSALGAINAMPTDLGFNKLSDYAVNKFDGGKHMTEDEWKTSEFAIPGVSHKEGVNKNVARLDHNRYKFRKLQEETLSNMPKNALSAISESAGTLIGTLAFGSFDVPELLAIKGTTALTGKLAPFVLSKLENKAAILGAKAAIGAGEGAAIATPLALAQDINDEDIGQHDGLTSVLFNIGSGAGLGGVVRMGWGWNRASIKNVDHRMAQDVGLSHALQGKAAYVGETIKNGAYQMSAESVPFVEKAENMVRKFEPELEAKEKEILETRKTLSKRLEEKSPGRKLEEFEKGDEFVKKIEEIREKPEEFHEEEEEKLLRKFKSATLSKKETPILKKVFDISEKPALRRTPEEESFLNDFVSGKEKEVTGKEIEDLKSKKDEIKSKLDEEKTKERKTKLRFKMNDIEGKIRENSARLDDLNKIESLKDEDTDTFKLRNDLLDQIKERNLLKSHILANKTYAKAMNANNTPVAKSDLRSTTKWIDDWKSDFTYSEKASKLLAEELDAIGEDASTNHDLELDAVNDLREKDLLSDEEKDYLDSFEEETSRFNKVSKFLRTYAKCIIGSGGS